MVRIREDLTGKIFCDLKVIEFSHSEDNGRYWTCESGFMPNIQIQNCGINLN